mmetsp:Transcript_89948/g.259247  ORF Transcript_89948/g.259247 Transcript_89948/m.259247 type:complete len:231 (+) Transcript_89948:2325-3017(+)
MIFACSTKTFLPSVSFLSWMSSKTWSFPSLAAASNWYSLKKTQNGLSLSCKVSKDGFVDRKSSNNALNCMGSMSSLLLPKFSCRSWLAESCICGKLYFFGLMSSSILLDSRSNTSNAGRNFNSGNSSISFPDRYSSFNLGSMMRPTFLSRFFRILRIRSCRNKGTCSEQMMVASSGKLSPLEPNSLSVSLFESRFNEISLSRRTLFPLLSGLSFCHPQLKSSGLNVVSSK